MRLKMDSSTRTMADVRAYLAKEIENKNRARQIEMDKIKENEHSKTRKTKSVITTS